MHAQQFYTCAHSIFTQLEHSTTYLDTAAILVLPTPAKAAPMFFGVDFGILAKI